MTEYKKTDMVWAYNSKTGKKLLHKVPYAHILLIPHLELTPKEANGNEERVIVEESAGDDFSDFDDDENGGY